MSHLIRQMKFLDGVVQVELAGIVLLLHLLMLDVQCTILKVDLIKLDFDLFKLCFELLDAFLSFLLDLAETYDFSLGFLSFQLNLVHL